MPYEFYQFLHWVDSLNPIEFFIYFFALIGAIDVFMWIIKKVA
jgi:hypothetical protein